jgi:hypothetical protein
MPYVDVKVKCSPTGGKPNTTTKLSVHVSRKPPSESEVTAAIRQKHPEWNFIILEIK